MDMEKNDFLRPGDEVTITFWSPEGERLFTTEGTSYHSLDSAVKETVEKGNLQINPEDCVFEITNHTTDLSHRYRINAHGNLKLIV